MDIRESCDKSIATLNEVLVLDKLESGILMLEAEAVSPYDFMLDVLRPFHVQVYSPSPPSHSQAA